jgi:hypothetical protein
MTPPALDATARRKWTWAGRSAGKDGKVGLRSRLRGWPGTGTHRWCRPVTPAPSCPADDFGRALSRLATGRLRRGSLPRAAFSGQLSVPADGSSGLFCESKPAHKFCFIACQRQRRNPTRFVAVHSTVDSIKSFRAPHRARPTARHPPSAEPTLVSSHTTVETGCCR